jgi:hypothetical protein
MGFPLLALSGFTPAALVFSFFVCPKKETKKGHRQSIYSMIGEAAMWIQSAKCTVHHVFDIGQQCPVTQKVT